jgi:hypothetical protein
MGLPVLTLAALQSQCVAALSALAVAQLGAAQGVPGPVPHSTDRTLDADEIARALGVNRRWVFRNAAKLPFVRRISRKALTGSEIGLRRWRETKRA